MFRSRWWILILLAAIALACWIWLINHGPTQASGATVLAPATTVAEQSAASPPLAAPAADSAAVDGTGPDNLPPEARTVLRLIASNGPFPYDRDGAVFGNYEHRLPEQPRGYYHEYTVPTPGAHNRGARRIITGGEPPHSYYYTDDHYETFRPIEPQS